MYLHTIIFIELLHVLLHVANLLCIIILPEQLHLLYFSLDALSGYIALVFVIFNKKSVTIYNILLATHIWVHTHVIFYLYGFKEDYILDIVFEQQMCKTFSQNIIYIVGTLLDILFHISNVRYLSTL